MKRAAALALLLSAAPLAAHVGSPNVFFDGAAGPYPVRVIVRPPDVIPGLAEITVRTQQAQAERVTLQLVPWRTWDKGAPPPDVAEAVPGDPELWSSNLWFMVQSSFSVRVHVEGAAGQGEVLVPVAATAQRILPMKRGMGAVLAALGFFLFVGAVTLAGSAVRESSLGPGETPGPRRRNVARFVMVATALFLALLLWGGKSWWDGVAAEAQADIFKPFAVESAARLDGSRQTLTVKVADERSRDWTPFMPDHGKLMHLFLLREPGLDAFAHVHPVPVAMEGYKVALPPLPSGTYRLYADVVHESGFPQTLVDTVAIPAAPEGATASSMTPDPDDSWSIGQPAGDAARESLLEGGGTMLWHREPLAAGRETTLRFSVRTAEGDPAALEPYMGMLSHAVVTRQDGTVFVHLHPAGSINMTAQQLFATKLGAKPAMDHSAHGGPSVPSEVTFPYAFPKPGRYRLWVQVKSGGQVMTGVFDAEVG